MKKKFPTSFLKIRNELYEVQFTRWKHLLNFRSPYSLLKAIYYIETASFFLFTTQRIIKSPNLVTFFYILSGLLGAVLIHSSDSDLFLIGLFLVFTKGTFDWADGPLARRLNKTSFIGHALDVYGAYLNDLAFRVSFIFFTIKYFPDLSFLLPIFLFIVVTGKFSQHADILFSQKEESQSEKNNSFIQEVENPIQSKGLIKWYFIYEAFLDSRARSIDFLLLMLLLNYLFESYMPILLLVLSLLIVLRSIISHIASLYYVFNVYNSLK